MEEQEKKFEKIEDLITQQGLLVSGIGIIPGKLDKVIELLDKNLAFKLHFIEKKLDEIIAEMKKKQ